MGISDLANLYVHSKFQKKKIIEGNVRKPDAFLAWKNL